MVGSQYGVWAARSALLAGVVGPALLLGGCSSSVITGVYGTPTEAAAPTQTASQAPLRVDFDPDTECPQINIPTGAAAYGPPSAQFSITNFARECDLASGNTVTIKVGVEGHVASAGGGGYSAPVRITIRDRDEKPVYTKVIRATAAATPGGGPGSFRVVDTSAPITIGLEQPLSSYDIVVGFDGKGGTVTKKKRRG
ncbi:hypothetical protein FZC33_27835 [Labrys sp. KNU-23]|uniref:hypothetical protein n=1 Tax=Labrys sp. KNU-23 TaxID=2789216 RepID=UPI0011F03EC9|nr:hypothetical protein [Labrys sp. KNU-23]QEN89888.1 hypothetical protein FZC33_27835 [Labrys sp. KNU-23]